MAGRSSASRRAARPPPPPPPPPPRSRQVMVGGPSPSPSPAAAPVQMRCRSADCGGILAVAPGTTHSVCPECGLRQRLRSAAKPELDQVTCARCRTVLTVPPSPGVEAIRCPICCTAQRLPPELMPGGVALSSSPTKPSSSAPPHHQPPQAQGVDPTKFNAASSSAATELEHINQQIEESFSHFDELWAKEVDKVTDDLVKTMKKNSNQIKLQDIEHFGATMKSIQKEHSVAFLSHIRGQPLPAKNFGSPSSCLAVIYDEAMLLHIPPGPEYDEQPGRLTSIVQNLMKEKLWERCDLFNCDEACMANLLAVHCPDHVKHIRTISTKSETEREEKAQEYNEDIYYSEGSSKAALLAAGGTVKACELIAKGTYKYSFALVRPPGHHAARDVPGGFCMLNNIAIGARHLLDEYDLRKVLIIDFDIHHGNGTQEIFYREKRVLYLSVHRRADTFYPRTGDGVDLGEGQGRGFNINLCWKHKGVRDVDYLTLWDYVVVPIMEEYMPEVILISAGFDAAKGDELGQCLLTPTGYSLLLKKMFGFCPISLILEGGYNLTAMPNCVASCVRVLLGEEVTIPRQMKRALPYNTTWEVILEARERLKPYWKALEDDIPNEIRSKNTPYKGVRDVI